MPPLWESLGSERIELPPEGPWVFGSVARGDAAPSSDVDFLVEFEPGRSLLDQVHLIDELGALLGTRVDVVARGGLLDRDHHIVAEAVPL